MVDGAVPGGGQRRAQGADDQPAHQGGVAKPDFGLGRVDVDVDLVLGAVEEQGHDRVAVARQQILIGAAHRADQELVAHRAAVDDEVLVARQGPVQGRQTGEAAEAETAALGLDFERILGKVAAEQGGEARAPVGRGGQPQQDRAGLRPVTVKAICG